VIDDDQRANGAVFETREKGLLPPLVTSRFVVRDCGNASPRFLRSTMYHIPATPDLLKQTGVPFALVVQPMAAVDAAQGEHEPPLTDFGLASGPVRCNRCKAYMCPFMQFIDGGRRFQCAFCKVNERKRVRRLFA
jgi:protein transport protein SEC24